MGTNLGRVVVAQYQILKDGMKKNQFTIDEIDTITRELLDYLSELTVRGITEIGNETVDQYKERVWNLIERVGLLSE